jgi:hypothetical protein
MPMLYDTNIVNLDELRAARRAAVANNVEN